MKTKRLWNNSNIEVVEIEGRWFALHGWNGYQYNDCWETDENTSALVDSETYIIKPVYKVYPETNDIQDEDGDMEVIGYEIM